MKFKDLACNFKVFLIFIYFSASSYLIWVKIISKFLEKIQGYISTKLV